MMRLNRSHLRNLQKVKRRKIRGKVEKLKPRAEKGIQVLQKRRLSMQDSFKPTDRGLFMVLTQIPIQEQNLAMSCCLQVPMTKVKVIQVLETKVMPGCRLPTSSLNP